MVLKRVYRKSTRRFEYALVSKTNPRKILYYFGISKPGKSEFLRQERRVQFWKSRKSFGSFPKRRVWVKRRDRVKQRYWIGRSIRKNFGSIKRLSNKELLEEMIGGPRIGGSEEVKQILSKTFKTPFNATTKEDIDKDLQRTTSLSRTGLVTHLKSKLPSTMPGYLKPWEDTITTFVGDNEFITVTNNQSGRVRGYISDSIDEASKLHKKLEEDAITGIKDANTSSRRFREMMEGKG